MKVRVSREIPTPDGEPTIPPGIDATVLRRDRRPLADHEHLYIEFANGRTMWVHESQVQPVH